MEETTEKRLKAIEQTVWGNHGGYKEGLIKDMKNLKEKQIEHQSEFEELKRRLAFWHGAAATVIVIAQIALAVWLRSNL